jgi:beta-phosphoglucomutase-like phosphatase (HAD superfamily)
MKLVLFDIDATLLSTGAASADAMRDVFTELCGIPDGFTGIEMSGKTDMAIFREAHQHQLDETTVPVDAFQEHYIARLRLTLQGNAPTSPHARDSASARSTGCAA